MKKLLALFLTLAALLVLVACGEAPITPTEATTAESDGCALYGHEFIKDLEKAPCADGGYPTLKCIHCGKTIVDHIAKPVPHTEVFAQTILPTTTSEGRTYGMVCSVCGEILSVCEPIPKLTASVSTATELPLDFNTFKDNLNASRHEFYDNFKSPDLPDFTSESGEPALTDEEARMLATEREEVETITKEQAIEDADLYFRAFKDFYAMYYYLGEDKFLAARDSVMEKLNALEYGATINVKSFLRDILTPPTDTFITDLHFPHGTRDYVQYYYYYVSGLFFHEDTDGYYFKNGDDKWYVVGIDGGGDIADYIKLTISPEGELVYGIGYKFILKDETPKPAYIVLKNGNVELNYAISWTLSDTKGGRLWENLTDPFSTSVEDGYNVIRISLLRTGDPCFEEFVETGKELKGENYIILDYRGNGGGNDIYTYSWLENYIDYPFGFWFLNYFRVDSPLVFYSCYGTENDASGMKRTVSEWKHYEDGWIRENDNTVFWLTDNQCGSSGDASIYLAQHQESMIVIGTHTAGCCGIGGWVDCFLPNSGIFFGGAQEFQIHDGKNAQCVGFDPDIWVPSEYALELTIKMCEYYGLEPGEKKVETYGTAPERVSLDGYASY